MPEGTPLVHSGDLLHIIVDGSHTDGPAGLTKGNVAFIARDIGDARHVVGHFLTAGAAQCFETSHRQHESMGGSDQGRAAGARRMNPTYLATARSWSRWRPSPAKPSTATSAPKAN